MTLMPVLETERLRIRPFVMDDLGEIHQLLSAAFPAEAITLEERGAWLQWAMMNHEQLAKLFQPPYGDRAIVLKPTDQLIGAVGYVPCLMPFERLPYFQSLTTQPSAEGYTPEFGLFYALSSAHRRRGYASEAAQAMIHYTFTQLRLKRIVATTSYDNAASIGVMRKLGMRLERNPDSEPPWLQVVGVLENPQFT